jgi:hypothetical protein
LEQNSPKYDFIERMADIFSDAWGIEREDSGCINAMACVTGTMHELNAVVGPIDRSEMQAIENRWPKVAKLLKIIKYSGSGRLGETQRGK